MISITLGTKKLFNFSVRVLNQPVVKTNVKNIASSVTFIFGFIEMYDIYHITRYRKISLKASFISLEWIQIVHKVAMICAKISLILSASVSRPGVMLISSLTGYIFSPTQLDHAFGPNTIFTINPWHPRHVISIVAVLLALPSVVQTVYQSTSWLCRKIYNYNAGLQQSYYCLTQSKIQLMTLFNTITCRPTLHIGNQLCRFIIKTL